MLELGKVLCRVGLEEMNEQRTGRQNHSVILVFQQGRQTVVEFVFNVVHLLDDAHRTQSSLLPNKRILRD